MSSVSILGTKDAEEWLHFLSTVPHKDISFYPQFARVYEESGDGVAECFLYVDGELHVLYPYIKRTLQAVPVFGEEAEGLYDIVNPYCYGGFIHNAPGGAPARELLTAFRREFDAYAGAQGIVSEFIRFHPFLASHAECEGLLPVELRTHNILIDLELSQDELLSSCRDRVRSYIRHGRRAGLELVWDRSTKSVDCFAELYRRSMMRHGQTGYYNFPKKFFQSLFANLGGNLHLFSARSGDGISAMAIYLQHEDYMDYLFGASEPELLHLRPNHFIHFEIELWAKRHGMRWLHLGGGIEPVLFFKQGFGKNTVPYYIGKKVHIQSEHDRLCEIRVARGEAIEPTSYFPAYRAGLE